MDIPRYWAEHREQRTLPGRRRLTHRRFGWSSRSQEDAQRHAEQRVAEAWAAWDAGRPPTRWEAKVAYGGADGLPIREEILEEHPDLDVVVTRNAYGSRCLNVPDILFADVDLGEPGEHRRNLQGLLIFLVVQVIVLIGLLMYQGWGGTGWPLLLLFAIMLPTLWGMTTSWRRWRSAVHPEWIVPRLQAWCASHPTWRLRVYRTPAGLRLLATHGSLNPRSEETEAFFAVVSADPMYRLMCRKQACFRARVSPKPWRIGIRERIGYGTWPSTGPSAVERRSAWIAQYEAAAIGYAACAFMTELGAGTATARGSAVATLHDRLAGVAAGAPLA